MMCGMDRKHSQKRRTVEAEAGFQAQGVARAQAAQAVARVLQQLLCQLHRALVRHADLESVLAGVPEQAAHACHWVH